ncbi:Tyrosine-protein kinase STK [Holothuria leucospilota]|uniref:Tyrosine-protein kinase n=1 Tax=Holothuria leucospilota TaxID=206669 RepID=A0A9Q1H301_HOLLE|nr:Tyrosine-protein kinase STK [Holothuria leucospilota]
MGSCCGKSRQTEINKSNGKATHTGTIHTRIGSEVTNRSFGFDSPAKDSYTPTPAAPVPPQDIKIYVALYDYTQRTHKDLGFRKGEVFEVLDRTDAAWWLARSTISRREGYIPSNYVAEQKTLEAEEWYFSTISRKDADKRLMNTSLPVGTFLIRKSQTHTGNYSLSVRDIDEINGGEHVKHYRIHWVRENNSYCITESCQFRTVPELIDHYRHVADGLNVPLGKPCPKVNPNTIGLGKDAWEIDRNSLKFQHRLGTGQFGEVWKGLWNGITPVAIKTMKSDTLAPSYFLAEANIMKKMKHKHLVQLFAICSDREPIYIVTELMTRGSLLELLRSAEGQRFPFEQLVDISAQIASGMQYLENQHYVHRDLAARNVLVNDNFVCKVADFGLARVIDEFYQHRPNPNKQLKFPLKWTAPEAAFYGRFTIKSDVWSYGILLAEIFSYGAPPYGNKSGNQVLSEIEKGGRMQKMPGWPDHIYQVMLDCWKKDPRQRPTFEYLHSLMDDYAVATEQSYREPNR